MIDNSWCIYETGSTGNIIEYNYCSPPTVQEPIFIDATATGIGANNWTWAESQSWCSGSGAWNDPYIIENLSINGFGVEDGIAIWDSNVSFIIQDCLIYNSYAGIYLDNVNNSRLIDNNCSNSDLGIYLEYSSNNTITGNTVNDNYEGIFLDKNCDNNTISANTANGNEYEGIYLFECTNNILSGNTVNDNLDEGIHLTTECVNNIITGNTVNNNGIYGIFLDDETTNNIISGNILNNNDYGIALGSYCDNNMISGNKVSNNIISGIYILEQSNNNTFSENILYNNTIGIDIDNSDNNSIYKNFFLENGKHAEDGGTDNKWNSTSIGNYWDNWTSPDVSPNDGIVDLPYNISGPAGSKDYLPIAEDGAPSITINSPTPSDVFGVTAPSFDVTITDDYLYEMWYTIDGGINNYTFIENGIINQLAWDAMPEGNITLTFYASDIPGNIGTEDVTIKKDTVAPVIIINSPAEGEIFGNTAPLFNITITEDNLDSIWYSFDGGLTTYTIINSGTFDQTAWTALSQGNVTITFYARDLAGNEASEAVTIVKRISAGGLDPGIIITIVVVSIAGGIAATAVIYIYLKKRASPK